MAFEFSQKFKDYDAKKHDLSGRWLSEKLDGHFCLWDGGISRGLLKSEVPWANTSKDARFKKVQHATGLWSSYANVIHAPAWFLDTLPKMPLCGELYQEGQRQDLSSIIKKLEPIDHEWKGVTHNVFDIPCYAHWLQNREVKNTNYKKKLFGCFEWAVDHGANQDFLRPLPFNKVLEIFVNAGYWGPSIKVVPQFSLQNTSFDHFLNLVVEKGGEGVVVRNNMPWYPTRNDNALKHKPLKDMEGTVIGYITGRETDKGSKLLGMMGAMILHLDNGKQLELSGFTDEERKLQGTGVLHNLNTCYQWACENPETLCPDWIEAIHFPRGTRVTFKYRCLTRDGVPQEARYHRIREGE